MGTWWNIYKPMDIYDFNNCRKSSIWVPDETFLNRWTVTTLNTVGSVMRTRWNECKPFDTGDVKQLRDMLYGYLMERIQIFGDLFYTLVGRFRYGYLVKHLYTFSQNNDSTQLQDILWVPVGMFIRIVAFFHIVV